MAGGSAVPEADGKAEIDKDAEVEEKEDEAKEDDKLYCVCKTRYDEDRVMIACDRCVFILLGLLFIG
jgi:COMPASS component SPP1